METSLCEWIEWLIWAYRGGVREDMEQIVIAPLMVEGLSVFLSYYSMSNNSSKVILK